MKLLWKKEAIVDIDDGYLRSGGDGLIKVIVELRLSEHTGKELSFSGEVNTDSYFGEEGFCSGGQVFDSLVPHKMGDIKRLYELWKRWHLSTVSWVRTTVEPSEAPEEVIEEVKNLMDKFKSNEYKVLQRHKIAKAKVCVANKVKLCVAGVQ